jgi:hypothetical protein
MRGLSTVLTVMSNKLVVLYALEPHTTLLTEGVRQCEVSSFGSRFILGKIL